MAQKKFTVFFPFGVVRLGGVLERGGGGGVHVSGGRGLHGVSEGGRGDLSSRGRRSRNSKPLRGSVFFQLFFFFFSCLEPLSRD